jgi:hypothetical protein
MGKAICVMKTVFLLLVSLGFIVDANAQDKVEIEFPPEIRFLDTLRAQVMDYFSELDVYTSSDPDELLESCLVLGAKRQILACRSYMASCHGMYTIYRYYDPGEKDSSGALAELALWHCARLYIRLDEATGDFTTLARVAEDPAIVSVLRDTRNTIRTALKRIDDIGPIQSKVQELLQQAQSNVNR